MNNVLQCLSQLLFKTMLHKHIFACEQQSYVIYFKIADVANAQQSILSQG